MPRSRSTEIDAWVLDEAMDEDDLVAAACRDRGAFAPLYRRYVGPIYRFCYRRLGNREEAEDATSQVFAKALAALERYRAGSFRAWLFTIASHVVTDRHRARRPTWSLDAAADVRDVEPMPEEIAVADDELRVLQAMLNDLSEDQRLVVELRLSGLTGQEIAEAMHRNRGAVDALQFRAVHRLRRLMARHRADEEGTDAAH